MACMHDHSCEEHDCSSDWSLYKHIDLSKVSALNEAVSGSVKTVFKAWEQRLNSSEDHLESNVGDPELIVFIPVERRNIYRFGGYGVQDHVFTSDVKIKSISIVGGADGTSPAKMRAFINREGIDFSDAENLQPVQGVGISRKFTRGSGIPDQGWDRIEESLNLRTQIEPSRGAFWKYIPERYSKFQSVGNITLHFPVNFGGHTTQIHYIGLKGEATQMKRDVVATIVYELMPNPSDHKTRAEAGGGLSQVE
ncbi:hypothetical protein OROGR_005951 [Orobanche gracilis]